MASESKEDGKRVMRIPRFAAPIAADKIRTAPAPPSMFDLLESVSVAAPIGVPDAPIGTGVGVEKPAAPRPEVRREPREPGEPREPREPGEPREPRERAPPAVPPVPAPGAPVAAGPIADLVRRIEAVVSKDKVLVHPTEFVPTNRRAFKQFIIQSYRRYLLPKLPDVPDPDACAKEASKKEVKTFAYQSFVRDYIQKPSPYRGVLVYHGLGSGKTCTSIASMEALYQADPNKPVFIMTPASLSPNYKGEISKCGPFVFRTDNFWTWVPIPSLKVLTPEADLVINRLGIPVPTIRKQKGAWLPDPTKKSNFESKTAGEQAAIQQQIKDHIEYRFSFIHYNGIKEATVRNWACNNPSMFDGATIIIDEVHNLIRTINNASLENFYKDEPRDLATYMPKFCEVGKKYRISYLLYRMLCNSVGCKIIALSATPIINFPQEVAILANLLAGDTRLAEVNTDGLDKRTQIVDILQRHPEVDFVEVLPRPDVSKSTIRMTPVPSGCRKVIDDATGAFRGFIRDEYIAPAADEVERERDLHAWFDRVKSSLEAAGIRCGEPVFKSLTRLPDLEKDFTNLFIDKEALTVKPAQRLALMARLSGLISYYKGGKADLMARVTRDEEVFVDMSDLQLKKYTEQRKLEIDKELRQKRKDKKAAGAGAGTAVGYADATKSVNSTFKIFSRAACNFVFPAEMERPIPADFRDVLKMIGARPGQGGDEVMEDHVDDQGNEMVVDEAAVAVQDEDGAAAAPAAVEASAAAGNTHASYERAVAAAVAELKSRATEFFGPGALVQHSPKFQAILDRLLEAQGPALIYSTFKTLEGVGLFGVAMEVQQGFKKFDIVQTAGGWTIAPETLTAGPGTPRFITYTGDEDRAKRDILLAIFNGKWQKVPPALAAQVKELTGADNNREGRIAKVFIITQSGAEGISLANVRQVHLMEPYWNYVRMDQVKGRAIRICSHMDLPPDQRTVDVFTYISKFSETQLRTRAVDETLLNFDGGLTTDQNVLELLKSKKKLADSILDVMKQSAVDCELNSAENGGYACYRFAGEPSMEQLFHPILDVGIAEDATAFRERA